MKSAYVGKIEEIFRERSKKHSLFVPSGRIAIYLAATEWLQRGDRVLISPVNDDVVFYTLLAAGIAPVLAPLDPTTGNIDILAVGEQTWKAIKAVITTNLYGIPDKIDLVSDKCRHHDVLLMEDACQAVDSYSDGVRVGATGQTAFYSFSKQVQGVGGILAFEDKAHYENLIHKRNALLYDRTLVEGFSHGFKSKAKALLGESRLNAIRKWENRHDLSQGERGKDHRMPYDLDEVVSLCASPQDLHAFDRWMRVDNSYYRTTPLKYELKRTLRNIEALESQKRKRIDGTKKLLDLDLTPAEIAIPMDQLLHRVPLFVQNREDILKAFSRKGLSLDYIYDPPLDRYVPEVIAARLPSPSNASLWSENILPVNPLLADEFLTIKRQLPPLLPVTFK